MKKTLFFAAASVAAAILASCTKTQSAGPEITDSESPIIFAAGGTFSAGVQTKGSYDAVTSLARFYAAATKGTETETAIWSNSEFTKGSGDTYSGQRYWPATDQQYNFYAANEEITFTPAGVTVSCNDNKDLVCAYLPYQSGSFKAQNTLTFNHVQSRIGTCNISKPEGYEVSGLTVKITPRVRGIYNIKTGSWADAVDGSETTLTNSLGSAADNNLYLLPGDYTLTASYTISKGAEGEYSETLTKTASVTLEAGKINNISATLPEGSAEEIVFKVAVTAWTVNSLTPEFS